MTTIYFVTNNNAVNIEEWTHLFFNKECPSKANYFIEKKYAAEIDKHYAKVTFYSDTLYPLLSDKISAESERLQFDYFIKPNTLPKQGIIAFDMDSTFIEQEGVDEIAASTGLSASIAELTSRAMEGALDFNASFTQRIGMLKGTPVSILDSVYEQMTLSPGIERLLTLVKKRGFKTAIISGGLDYFTQRLRVRYGLDYSFSNAVEIKDNALTGNISFPIMNAQHKRETLISLAEKLNIERRNVIACGDGANDLPMLHFAGVGVAYRAKPIVRNEIKNRINHNGFETLLFLIEENL